jgi:DNA-binding HxlR family transcriptional regulator
METSPVLNSKNCPVTHAIKIMGRRWKPLVLNYLKPGPLRFSELRRCIPEATQKMLTQTLRELEQDGIVLRKSYPQVPPKVVYSITRYGRTLDPILIALCDWGKKNFKRQGAYGSPKKAPPFSFRARTLEVDSQG